MYIYKSERGEGEIATRLHMAVSLSTDTTSS